jgi:Leucine-rich repeat (LRR) protein
MCHLPPPITPHTHTHPCRRQVLNLSMNDLAEVDSEVFIRMPSLTSLNLRQNALRHLPTTIGALKSLVSLNVGCNRLSYLPSSLGFCRQLRVLMADNNRMEAVPGGELHVLSLHNEPTFCSFKLTFVEQ